MALSGCIFNSVSERGPGTSQGEIKVASEVSVLVHHFENDVVLTRESNFCKCLPHAFFRCVRPCLLDSDLSTEVVEIFECRVEGRRGIALSPMEIVVRSSAKARGMAPGTCIHFVHGAIIRRGLVPQRRVDAVCPH